MTPAIWLILFIFGAAGVCVWAALLLALHDLSRGRLEDLAADSDSQPLKQHAEAIIADIPGHLAAAALPVILFGVLTAAAGLSWTAAVCPPNTPAWLSLILGIAASSAMLWLFAAAIPIALGEHAGDRLVLLLSAPLRLLHAVMLPLRAAFALTDEIVRRLAGAPRQPTAEQLEQEILDVVEEHGLGSDIGEEERDMLEAIVEFRSTTVGEIMTPRTDIEALEYSDDIEQAKRIIDRYGHSRVPVYDDNLDAVVGILYAKDLLRWITNHAHNGRPFVLKDILRPAIFVPETKTVRELLTELLADRVHIAMVTDPEYGGTSGLVTLEDIVEEVFGEIADEYDKPEPDPVIVNTDNRSASIDAKVDIDDANDQLEPIGIEIPEHDDYDTVGGFVVVTLGRIPPVGEVFTHDDFQVRILEAEPTRVVRVAIEPAPAVQTNEA